MSRSGMGLAGALLFALGLAAPAGAARPAAATASGDSVLVRIGKEAITTSMVKKRIDDLPEQARPNYTTPEGKQRLLERMVEEKVWLMTALKHGVDTRPDVRRQLEQQRRDFLIRTYVTEVMATHAAPTDSEARAYYEAHKSDYMIPPAVTLSHIQLKTEAEAKRVLQWARAGQDWKKLAARYSADTLTRASGGTLGSVTREGQFGSLGRQPALAESAFAIGEGKIGGPYHTDRGWHVLKVESVRAESTRPYEQMMGSIVRQLSAKGSQDFYQARLAETKAALGVKPDSNAIRNFVSQRKTAREMFNEAQSAGPPDARIEAYQHLLQEYPTSDVSPQAQFMIGFIHSEELKDYDQAEKAFHQVIEKYPKSELVRSAKWMIEHMRSEGAPDFMNLESDSSKTVSGPGKTPSAKPAPGKRTSGGKP